MRWTGQIFWLLAFGRVESFYLIVERLGKAIALLSTLNLRHSTFAPFSPPSPRGITHAIGFWEVVSSYSSATAPDSHGISCADPHINLAKN
jgi:hypothetical protein